MAFGDRVVTGAGRSVAARRRGIGFVPQEGGLFPHLSVARNISFGLSRRQRRDDARVRELLDLVGLDAGLASAHRTSSRAVSSSEWRWRGRWPRALARPAGRALLLPRRRAPRRDPGGGGLRARGDRRDRVLVTHDQAEALSIADQVAVLRQGRLVQLTDPRTLYRQPTDLDVAAFVGEAVILDADVRSGVAHCVLGDLSGESAGPGDALPDGPARVLLRPEQLRLGAPGADAPVARVLRVDFYGHDSRVWLSWPTAPR